jgi:tyrosine-protein phosphatase
MTRALPTTIQPFPSLVDSPPLPKQSAPAVSGFSFFDQQQEPAAEPYSIMSPITASFPRDFPLRSSSPQFSDSSRLTPRKNVPRPLKTKFSSPNLQESKRLARLQNQIDPKRHMDDLDALMSPRATQFTSNPFHDLLAVPSGDTPVEAPQEIPVTPTSAQSDPRSPAQQGISPITRNIFDVL